MTIKRRLFFLNVRAALITVLAVIIIVGFFRLGSMLFDKWFNQNDLEYMKQYRSSIVLSFIVFISLVTIVGMINYLLNYRLVQSIKDSLELIGEGVRQIQYNNLGHRIDYRKNDEFFPLCKAFNEMAAKLETLTIEREKYETNRRELIAGISHDLRTPLTSIKGYLEGLETTITSTAGIRKKYISTIKNKTIDLEQIIEQLFLFSKLDMEDSPFTMRRINITLAVSDMLEEAAGEYTARGLMIHIDEMPEPVFVNADTFWLHHVLINILENSVTYKVKAKGNIEVSAVLDTSSVIFRFADDGPGVHAGAAAKLFDVFYRAEPSRNTKGSGLGLAISAKIVEHMGGTIHAELPESGGIAIVIQLPLSKGEDSCG